MFWDEGWNSRTAVKFRILGGPGGSLGSRMLTPREFRLCGCATSVDEDQRAWFRDPGAAVEKSELQKQCMIVEGRIESAMKEYVRRRKPLEEIVRVQREELERRKVRGKPLERLSASVVRSVGFTGTVGCGWSRGVSPRFSS